MPRLARVLGVDDNSRNLAILRRTLARDCELMTASSGEEALAMAPRFRPDIVLLDIMMPAMDGYETCRRLRAHPETASAKIILVSAKALTAERLEGYAAGADDYVVKPFDPDELSAKVRVYSKLKSVEEVDQLRGDLLTLLSHGTRTPLTTILSPLPLLLMGENLTPEQRRLLQMMESGATRLLRLIENGCFLARLRAGDLPFDAAPLDLTPVVQGACDRADEAAAARQVRVNLSVDGTPIARADASMLGQALDAVLDNAIRFSPAGGVVDVHAWSEGPLAQLSVSDNGPGIPPDHRAHVFEPLTVADVRVHSGGQGMGLAIARAIADMHGGRLWLDESATTGTTFRFELPMAVTPAVAA